MTPRLSIAATQPFEDGSLDGLDRNGASVSPPENPVYELPRLKQDLVTSFEEVEKPRPEAPPESPSSQVCPAAFEEFGVSYKFELLLDNEGTNYQCLYSDSRPDHESVPLPYITFRTPGINNFSYGGCGQAGEFVETSTLNNDRGTPSRIWETVSTKREVSVSYWPIVGTPLTAPGPDDANLSISRSVLRKALAEGFGRACP